ncbi:hypothetical protein [Burkholderia cenocepacia]|uniref:hypothetical protein n=1 Tax=Burkholderia cenocepacia TaxID=95486 RepID=UPI002ABD1625|nr:hypothetical protein [Burkholderia cenocepacia]
MFVKAAAAIIAGVILFTLANWYGRSIGARDGQRSLERVQLVWPGIESMPVQDRVLIAGMAMTCHVEKQPPVASAVVACLRDAAADPNVQLPKGMDWRSAQTRLNQLLEGAGVQ